MQTHSEVARQAKICESVRELRTRYAHVETLSPVRADEIVSALHQFQECVRYLRTRRSTGAVLKLEREADVQDAIYLMLRPWIHDLTTENPTDRIANRYTIKDFISPSAMAVIEIKYVRDASHGKHISRELHDDIENYRHHPKCQALIFFIYDPDSLIPDQAALQRQIEVTRTYGGRSLRCVLIVKP